MWGVRGKLRGIREHREQQETNGGAEGDRTPDPDAASVVLSQLSYSPV